MRLTYLRFAYGGKAMKQKITTRRNTGRSNLNHSLFNQINWQGMPATATTLVIFLMICLAALGFAVRAYSRKPIDAAVSTARRLPSAQAGSALPGQLNGRLSVQPEANLMRRRLGKRFISTGREVSLLTGTLTVENEAHSVVIRRSQDDTGENISVMLDGGQTSLTWNQFDGARASGSLAAGDARLLTERIALDSPDQFVLAQTRGASYYLVAHYAKPEEARGSEDYDGPVWDLVRIGEPEVANANKPLSPSRLYYINSSTGLIDRVVSQESADTVVAEVSGWINQGGEMAPSRITWRRNNQVAMELTVNNIGYGPKQ